jgi:hypothetical protein
MRWQLRSLHMSGRGTVGGWGGGFPTLPPPVVSKHAEQPGLAATGTLDSLHNSSYQRRVPCRSQAVAPGEYHVEPEPDGPAFSIAARPSVAAFGPETAGPGEANGRGPPHGGTPAWTLGGKHTKQVTPANALSRPMSCDQNTTASDHIVDRRVCARTAVKCTACVLAWCAISTADSRAIRKAQPGG